MDAPGGATGAAGGPGPAGSAGAATPHGTCCPADPADPVGARAPHSTDCDLRLACRDGDVPASRCLLARASGVLRASLHLQLPSPGVLHLPADGAGPWRAALRLLSLDVYPLEVVDEDNVGPLLALADKYDMPLVRAACAHHLQLAAPRASLDPPLASPANILTAATLVAKYVAPHAALQPYCADVRRRLEEVLAPLAGGPPRSSGAEAGDEARRLSATASLKWRVEVLCLLEVLQPLVATPQYVAGVAPEVQVQVSSALVAALRGLARQLPPECGRCSLPVCSGDAAAAEPPMHADCAADYYAELHTRGCRMCGTPMPPAHARFCNSCAYRKHKDKAPARA